MTERIYYLPQYHSAPQRPQTNWTPWILVAIGFLLFQLSHQGWPFDRPEQDRDRQEQVDPVIDPVDDKPDTKPEPTNKPDIKDTFVVRVYETQASDLPAWLVLQIQNDKFWLTWLKAEKGVRLHTFDPDNSQAESMLNSAKAQGIKPPFWAHIRRDNQAILSINPFTQNVQAEDWKKIILGSVK